MRKFTLYGILLITLWPALGQTQLSADTRLFLYDMAQSSKNNDKTASFNLAEKYPVYLSNGTSYFSCIAKVNRHFNAGTTQSAGIRIGCRIGNIVTLRVPLNKSSIIASLPGVLSLEIAPRIRPTLDRATKDTRVDSVWQGIGLPQAYTGKGVLIGVTDWGFDYTNPMFYDTTLTYTRILRAWDQFRNAGPAPAGFDYGTEISGEVDLLAAQCDTFNVYQWATHGSHVSGIAGGSGAGTVYRGVAFEANFLMATFLVDAAAVLDAFAWMKNVADEEGMRLVINMSWGLYYIGNLDGTSLLSQAIDQLAADSVVFVSSAGNNGDVNFHIKETFSGPSDTLKTIVGFDNYSYYTNMWGQSLSMWGQAGNPFSASVRVYNVNDSLLGSSQFFSTSDTAAYREGIIVCGSDTIFYNLASDSANPENQKPHMRLRIRNLNTAYRIGLYVTSDSGTMHLWNIIELTNDVGNWGLPFSSLGPGWTAGDFHYGIGEPACTENLIAVAAYNSEYQLPNLTWTGGNIAYFSSYGPTMDNRMKPDISAPGMNVCSSTSSFTNAYIGSPTTTVTFNGRTYKFARFSGTSMSSPMVTGIVALMLEANKWLSPEQVKDILKITAREDYRTGDIPDTGSTRWGWGKVNAWRAVQMALTGIDDYDSRDLSCMVYPNPTNGTFSIFAQNTIDEAEIFLYNILGVEIYRRNAFTDRTTETIDISSYPPGLYILNIREQNRMVFASRIIKVE